MNLRCRGPMGQKTLTGLDPNMRLGNFLEVLERETGLRAKEIDILTGYPPAPVRVPHDPDSLLSCLAISNGDTLLIRRQETTSVAASEPTAVTSKLAANSPASEGTQMDEDEQLARAIAASLGQDNGHQPASAASASSMQPAGNTNPQHVEAARPEQMDPQVMQSSGQSLQDKLWSVTLPDGSGRAAVRREIASDNSCLFNAVGYVMERSRDRATALRQVIAETVAGDPDQYSDGFLGKPNAEYCQWIQDSQKWGGAIELAILSRFFAREIAAYDIQTKRCDLYGQDEDYSERVMLIYDGLHYDALAVAAFDKAPEEVDITVFASVGLEAGAITRAAAELVSKVHEARQFTDTANFTLRCKDCQLPVKGEKEAIAHAKATGHANFGEF
ncbi:hypothetical protein CVIRNUC_008348 [Coccomyxa viridis]|uniref:Ubiquitin thioesterase OTU n=1 Tax=Coccomyxa viridis TaxID=1274662 RepID=A0AAV1IG13_9CHLO|nr:hypothetical protein CVIRNUC_008348 [Coccomyxa viridis]